MTKRYVLGTNKEVDVMVQVTNLGEDSYETQVYISMPPGLSYINVHKVEAVSQVIFGTLDHGSYCSQSTYIKFYSQHLSHSSNLNQEQTPHIFCLQKLNT